jgi:single-strand DNA-binding protein
MASFNFNKVIIGGRLTADPTLKTTQNGTSVTSFSVAVNRRGKSGEDSQADFFNCTAWRGTAEFIANYFKKASSICIVGTLQNRSWKDNDGNKRYVTEIVVDEATFVDSKGEVSAQPTAAPTGYIPSAYTQPVMEEIDLEDETLPF